MKLITTLLSTLLVLTISSVFAADEVSTVNIGNAEVSYNYHLTDTGVAILALIALVPETNNSLRGLKNTDPRRLGKLGQLIYQCKLMLYKPDKSNRGVGAKDPVLISKSYSLFTGVNLQLAADERVGIQAQVLQAVDDDSLFTTSLGEKGMHKRIWETLGEDTAINLKQFNINVLDETDLIETSENIDIVVRFPVFQLEQPVSQWSYNFDLKDFKQAIRHVDENCTSVRLVQLSKQKT